MGISLALICDAQSLFWRVEEHFLVKSSKLSKIFLLSSSCKTYKAKSTYVCKMYLYVEEKKGLLSKIQTNMAKLTT